MSVLSFYAALLLVRRSLALTPLIRRLRRHLPPRWGRLYIEEIAHAISTLVVAFFNKVEHIGTLRVGVYFFHVFWA